MAVLGQALLAVALAACLVGAALYVRAARRRGGVAIQRVPRLLAYAAAALSSAAVVLLEIGFLSNDFSLQLVAENSSVSTPVFYKLTAMWSSQAGSLLLWLWLLSLVAAVVLHVNRRRDWASIPWAGGALCSIAAFFALLTVAFASPFGGMAAPPPDGVGLNPLLRNPSMILHPPALYLGYVCFAVPFAFAIGALVARETDARWIGAVRTYSVAAWLFLGIGIVLGARWSYAELGWGGYWAWDPVENASLMPWLTATAFIHTSIVEQRRGILKVWNMSLIIATFVLALTGTFLVRSGVLDSIHSFGEETVGTPILVFIATAAVGSAVLLVTRLDDLKPKRSIEAGFSRETAFLVNNLLLVGLCFVVFWGTFFPIISEAATGTRASVGRPWFDQYVGPLGIALVALMGLGSALPWRRSGARSLARNLVVPVACAAAVLVGLLIFGRGWLGHPAALASLALAAFACAAALAEFARDAAARRAITGEPLPLALAGIVGRNRRRYGGYIVHIGVAVLFVGVAASLAFKTTDDVRLRPGQTARVGGYEWRYVEPTASMDAEKMELGARVEVYREGKLVATLNPRKAFFPSRGVAMGSVGGFFFGESTAEVGLRAGTLRDLWVSSEPDLTSLERPIREGDRRFPDADESMLALILPALQQRFLRMPGVASFRFSVNPLVTWIWVGGVIILLGSILAVWPGSRRIRGRGDALRAHSLRSDRAGSGDLQTRKAALLEQIRDAEIDFRAGKLTRAQWEELDRSLRGEAVEILRKGAETRERGPENALAPDHLDR